MRSKLGMFGSGSDRMVMKGYCRPMEHHGWWFWRKVVCLNGNWRKGARFAISQKQHYEDLIPLTLLCSCRFTSTSTVRCTSLQVLRGLLRVQSFGEYFCPHLQKQPLTGIHALNFSRESYLNSGLGSVLPLHNKDNRI